MPDDTKAAGVEGVAAGVEGVAAVAALGLTGPLRTSNANTGCASPFAGV